MSIFKISIDCSNAAFDENEVDRDWELARILRAVAARVEDGSAGKAKDIHDANGNPVGQFWLEETP